MLTALLLAALTTSDTSPAQPFGDYVEARTASVYAGACHYNGEYTTQGRAAVFGFRIEGGEFQGVSLAGLELAVAVAADKNLAERTAKRRSIVTVDAAATPAVREAGLAWLRATHGEVCGEIVRVNVGDVEVRRAKDTFVLRAGTKGTGTKGKGVELTGAALPDRACCKMPINVWYDPLVPVQKRLVGCTEAFQVSNETLKLRFSRPEENSVFLGRFGTGAPAAAAK